MSRNFSEPYLDALLEREGLSASEIETFIALAQCPQNAQTLFASRVYDSFEEVAASLQELLHKGFITKAPEHGGSFFTLSKWDNIRKCFSKKNGHSSNILKRLKRLPFHTEKEMYGIRFNPALTKGSFGDSKNTDFTYLHETFRRKLPKVEIKAMCKCNLNCMYCYNQKNAAFSPLNTIKHEVEKARMMGLPHAIVSGGEFTIRKDNLSVLSAVAEAGFKDIELFTNGLMFYMDDVLKVFMQKGVTSLFLHVSAVHAQLYETLVQRKDSFHVLMKALENLAKCSGVSLSVFSVVNRINLKHLKDLVIFFHEYSQKTAFREFFHYLGFYCVYAGHSNAWENRQAVVPKMSEAVPYMQNALDAAKSTIPRVLYVRVPFCLMKGYEVYNFDLYCTLSKFILSKKTYHVDETFVDTLFTKKDRCRECIHDRYCVGVMRGYAKMYGLDEIQPVKK